jgi:hypothetical protein
MAGSAILDPDVLVDSLVVDVIDGLRGDLHPAFGVRAYRIFTVSRQWTGRAAGEGTYTDTEVELLPQPLVEPWEGVGSGLQLDLKTCGMDEIGQITLREVSLTYTEAELRGPNNLARNQQWFLKLTDAHGQGTEQKYFIHGKPPYVDRVKDMGWILWLREATA